MADPVAAAETLATGGAGMVVGMALVRVLEQAVAKWRPKPHPNAPQLAKLEQMLAGTLARLEARLDSAEQQQAATRERVDEGFAHYGRVTSELRDRIVRVEVSAEVREQLRREAGK